MSFEAPWWVARCLDVEVTSQGRTQAEALDMIREALELYFQDEGQASSPTPLSDPHLERLHLRIPA